MATAKISRNITMNIEAIEKRVNKILEERKIRLADIKNQHVVL